MRKLVLMGVSFVVIASILGVPAYSTEAPADDPPVLSEQSAVEDGVEMELPPELFGPEPIEHNLQPCELPDGTMGAYICTGSTCTNGLKCAQCCTGPGGTCGPLECVVKCSSW